MFRFEKIKHGIPFIIFMLISIIGHAQQIEVVPYYSNVSKLYDQIHIKMSKDQPYIQRLHAKDYVLNAADIAYVKSIGLQLFRVLRMTERFEAQLTNYGENAVYLLSIQLFKLKLLSESFLILHNNPKTYFIIDDALKRQGYNSRGFFKLIKRNTSSKVLNSLNTDIATFLTEFKTKYSDHRYESVVSDIFYNISTVTPYSNLNLTEEYPLYIKDLQQKKRDIRKYYLKRLGDASTGSLSKAFGNFFAVFSFRKGKLYQRNDFLRQVSTSLEPLDLLLEKAGFRLTDKLIPGFWGHVAVYIGNEEQLKALGIWEHEKVKPFHSEIRAGATIVEALRSGVKMNTLLHFSNIDDFAHLRMKRNLSSNQKIGLIIKALDQVGKKYDYNFDVENDESIICSELPYVLFDDIAWNTQKTFGRHTITVDEVAQQGKTGGEFSLQQLYLEGVKVDDPKSQDIYNRMDEMSKRALRKLRRSLKE